MLKYILSITIALTMLACSSDQEAQEPGQNTDDQQAQQQFEPNQPAPEIEVSDEELEQFTEVSMVAQEIQMGSQQEMLAIVEEEGLDVETYNVIAEARFNDQSDEELDVSSDDLEKFDAASEQIELIQQDVEDKMAEAVEAEGMEMDRFMEINMALQRDQELQQRVQQMMMEKMQEETQGQ
ncbi:MAG: DUF4168 domain-containing protein [Gracilimonas sp.]|uniref:DUF4168 domain-containing protein n=1 Tax=Gracilimonas sp. TaxID=1974203 RepID=UPI00199B831B|nr:DUF4168 domain-containing protein [Gracilimonas sp.]MBD3615265.1 DUF4168 domain-containing protein [Gracilimonas sp.]